MMLGLPNHTPSSRGSTQKRCTRKANHWQLMWWPRVCALAARPATGTLLTPGDEKCAVSWCRLPERPELSPGAAAYLETHNLLPVGCSVRSPVNASQSAGVETVKVGQRLKERVRRTGAPTVMTMIPPKSVSQQEKHCSRSLGLFLRQRVAAAGERTALR